MTKLAMPFDNPATYIGHSGVDYPQPMNTPIPASGSGVVSWLGWNQRGGYFIWVKYDDIAPRVGYHHMPSHGGSPRAGTRFNTRDTLGMVGSTGNSTGPHLHSEVEGHATTAGYWQFFDRSKVVTNMAGGNASPKQEIEDDEMTASFINVPGVAGKRRGGCYAIMRDNNGNLFARFISKKSLKSAPTVDTERAYNDLQASLGKNSLT